MAEILHDEISRVTTAARLGLSGGQMRLDGWKNRNWLLQGPSGSMTFIGFGDLSSEDLERIQKELSPGIEFVAGWKDGHKDLSDPTGEDIRVTHEEINTLRPAGPIF